MSGNPALRPETFSEFQDTPKWTCLRCGATLDYPLYPEFGGRPREYCTDACRRAASRARRKHGARWWVHQSWYPQWDSARQQWLADRQRVERQREESARFRAAMPASVRSGFDKAEFDTLMRGMSLAIVKMDVDRWAFKHAARLAQTGAEVRVISKAERRIEALLLTAVKTSDETEAAAMFAKARQLYAGGIALEAEATPKDAFLSWFGS